MHPYYPLDLHMPTWQPLAIPFEKILATFFTACGLVLTTGWWLTGSSAAATPTAMQSAQQSQQKQSHLVLCVWLAGKAKFLSTAERSMVCWFLCSGLIHLIIEGRFKDQQCFAFLVSGCAGAP